MNTLRNQSVLVIGLGETGLSLARFLHAQGARVRVADSRAEPPGLEVLQRDCPQAEVHCGAFCDALLDGVEMIAISPGIPLSDPFVQRAIACGIPVVGDVELFARQLATSGLRPATKVLAITGSNGKTTVTAMVEHLCRAVGRDAMAAGNISPAVLDAVMQRGEKQPEIWVLELSSFQLETTSSLNADAATVLNVSEDHLDRYTDMNAYAAAKARIFMGGGAQSQHGAAEPSGAGAGASHPVGAQLLLGDDCSGKTLSRSNSCAPTPNVSGVQILNRDDPRSMAMAIEGRKQITFGLNPPPVSTAWDGVEHDLNETTGDFGIERHAGAIWLVQGSERLLRADELQVSGLHNVANALAALALCRAIGLPMHKLLGALRGFKGLPHRVEKIAEMDGVVYYDDSKGTNVGATEAALKGLGRPAVVILGGEGKGQDFTPLQDAVARHARAVVLIGRDAPLIEAAIAGCGKPVLHARDMDEAVRIAATNAQSGDAVLLSPACASFDMFRSYVQRAEAYTQAVRRMAEATT